MKAPGDDECQRVGEGSERAESEACQPPADGEGCGPEEPGEEEGRKAHGEVDGATSLGQLAWSERVPQERGFGVRCPLRQC